ncbi:MAG: hypothetical protein SGI77_11605 [Pirellulaceae bacterium]|nr:hypothetical protein [Pirellulaceae bacterium]
MKHTIVESWRWIRAMIIAMIVLSMSIVAITNAQSPASTDLTTGDVATLDAEQKLLADRFGKLEELFIRMSELEAAANPTRASLLQQAAQLSKQLATLQRLNLAVELLAKGQFSRALQEQESTKENLGKLLELLQSENRQSRIREDRQRIEALIKDVQRLEKLQRSLRGRTEAGQSKESAARDQEDIREQASKTDEELADALGEESKSQNEKDSPEPKPQDSKPSDSEKSDSEKSDSKNSDSKKSDSKKSDSKKSDSKPSESQNTPESESSKSSNKEQADSQEGESTPEKQPPASPPTREENARERLKSAQQRMKKATQEIKKDQRQEAVEEQWAAEEELRQAAEELERILVQLREEEIERSLADLESRFRRMLEMQNRVLDQSKRLMNTAGANDDRQIEIQASKLSIEERKILMEGQKALLLLQDEGSSMAFPEAVQQMNEDIAWTVEAFSQSKINSSTISTQEEIITALEEMIESLSETQKKMEEKKKKKDGQSQGGGGGGDQEQPLVDALAELRLIKTLQLRINSRTQRLAKDAGQIDDPKGEVENAGILEQLRELAGRQDKIQQVTRDILLEQTKK